MPHGRLTPLGRQLRSVLAHLRPQPITQHQRNLGRRALATPPLCIDDPLCSSSKTTAIPRRHTSRSAKRWQSAVALADQGGWEHEADGVGALSCIQDDALLTQEDEGKVGKLSIGPDDNRGGEYNDQVQPQKSPHELSSYTPFFNRTKRDINDALLKAKDYPMNYSPNDPAVERRLETILYNFMEHTSQNAETPAADRIDPFTLSPDDAALMDSRSYRMSDFIAWTVIVANPDPLAVATRLEALQSQGREVPLFVLFHQARRQHISPVALKILLRVSFKTVETYSSRDSSHALNREDLFTLFALLLRRVRDSWPPGMDGLVDMLLQHLPSAESALKGYFDGVPHNYQPVTQLVRKERDHLASLGFRLNKAMRLLAIPTASQPFKTLAIQESCIIRILRFLAEHDPPLEINRDGYRAVILIQLAQPKSHEDRLWAELKALSWPPWKEDRTAMDSDVSAEDHGRSKAAETLLRMQEAGFIHHEWETVAGVYTGWDTDGTPSVQTRIHFNAGRRHLESGAALWAARIRTTRTIQEAWACYLAYENEWYASAQDVFLAMFRKLCEEEQRVRATPKYQRYQKNREDGKVWPGDALEIEPPPPSAHQHTYTARPPPSMHDFYLQLRDKGVVFEGSCLAFLVSQADSLKLGMEYIFASESVYPGIRGLLDPDGPHDLSTIPDFLFASFMQLLARFSMTMVPKALPGHLRHLRGLYKHPYGFDGIDVNRKHAIVHGLRLLKHRLPRYRPAWTAILSALARPRPYDTLLVPVIARQWKPESGINFAVIRENDHAFQTTEVARRLAQHITALMHSIHLDSDSAGLRAQFQIAENFAVVCWMHLRERYLIESVQEDQPELDRQASPLAKDQYPQLLKEYFASLVGKDSFPKTKPGQQHDIDEEAIHEPLEVPDSHLLHAYVRALGWMGDYDGMATVVQWMARHCVALRDRRELDPSGEARMRRAIVALRVFLERSWLQPAEDGQGDLSHKQQPACRPVGPSPWMHQLSQLQTPATKRLTGLIQETVNSVPDWGGWPTDEEVEKYCQHERFQQFHE